MHLVFPTTGVKCAGRILVCSITKANSVKNIGTPHPYSEYQMKRFLSLCFCWSVMFPLEDLNYRNKHFINSNKCTENDAGIYEFSMKTIFAAINFEG